MIKLPANQFTFGNYNADIPFDVLVDDTQLLNWLKQKHIIGYSANPEFKPIKGYIAVLIENEDFTAFWSHIPERVFNKLKISIDKAS